MVTFVFYKNCQLTNKYQSVFSGENAKNSVLPVFTKYLQTLEHKSITIEDEYYENSGVLTLDKNVLETPLEYNYMYVYFENWNRQEHSSERFTGTRYCFINRVELKNGCIQIYYEEDIWTSYCRQITGIDVTTLINSRVNQYGENVSIPFIKLPTEYEGDNELDLEYEETEDKKCYALVEIQFNQLASANDVGWRNTLYVVMADYNSATVKYGIQHIENMINALIQCSTWCKITNVSDQSMKVNYEIGDIYVLPSWIDISQYLNFVDYYYLPAAQSPINIGTSLQYRLYPFKREYFATMHLMQIGTIYKDYKLLSFGTFCSQYKLVNNGQNIPYKVYFTFDFSSISIKINIQNNLYDITEDYRYDVPVQSINADTFMQRKIGLEIQNTNLRTTAFTEGAKIGMGIIGVAKGIGNQILDYPQTSLSNMYGMGLANYTALFGGANAVRNVKLEKLINSPMYSNSKAVWGNSKHFLNFMTSLVTTKIKPDNKQYVKNCVDNYGYIVNSIIQGNDAKDIICNIATSMYGQNITYNYIRFDDITIYGNFSREVASKLENILENGVKIWYDENRTLDSYTNYLLN